MIGLIILLCITILIFLYCSCKVSSDCSKLEVNMKKDKDNKYEN